MAEEIKTTPAPEGQTLEPPAPEVSEAPPAPEPEAQGVIPGMEGPPSPENKVIDLSSVRAGAALAGQPKLPGRARGPISPPRRKRRPRPLPHPRRRS